MALVAVTKSCPTQASRLWQRTVGSHESQAAFLGLLTAVGHSVTLLDSRNLLFQAIFHAALTVARA